MQKLEFKRRFEKNCDLNNQCKEYNIIGAKYCNLSHAIHSKITNNGAELGNGDFHTCKSTIQSSVGL